MPKEIKKTKVEPENLKPVFETHIPVVEKTPIGSTILQYLSIILVVALIYAFFHYGTITIIPLSGPAVLFFSLACAFTWVEIMKWGVTKPFTCIKCMTGWIALLLALIFHVDHPYFYLPAGLFIGAVFEAIKMRYL